MEPDELVPGIEATLICDSSSSNPPAKITWWKDGIPVEGVNATSKSGLWGGTVSSLDLKINVTQDMNEVVYTCQSNNEALQRSVHEAITLQVLCKSFFETFVREMIRAAVGVAALIISLSFVSVVNHYLGRKFYTFIFTNRSTKIRSTTIINSCWRRR